MAGFLPNDFLKFMKHLRLGMIGLDTSHVSHFAQILHDPNNPHHVAGGRIVAAFPGGSPDFPPSFNRLEKFTAELRDAHNVAIVDSIAELKDRCDAILIESVDGRVHWEQFKQVSDWGLPVFIDKPLTTSHEESRHILELARANNVRVMSASALRYAHPFQEALHANSAERIVGGDFFGPMAFQEKNPGYFWYGIHCVEMLYETMGPGCQEVTTFRRGDYDLIVGQWPDGRIGTIRGNRAGNNGFGGVIHREKKSYLFDVTKTPVPYYASLLQQIMRFFLSGEEITPLAESVEAIAFIEAANRSAELQVPVKLA